MSETFDPNQPSNDIPVTNTAVTENENYVAEPGDDLVQEPKVTVTPPVTKPDVPKVKQQNCIQEYEYSSKELLKSSEKISMPSDTADRTKTVLQGIPNINLLDDPESRKWASNLTEGLGNTTYANAFQDTLEEEGSEFRHKIEHQGLNLTAQPPKFKPMENQNLKGERAVIRVINHLGLGTLFQVPLWHSGIWLTLKPPTDAELIELNRLMLSDKIQFGRFTYGMVFSNTTVYTVDRLVDFALSHVYDSTCKSEEIPIEQLKSIISTQDIFSIIWGLICTIYPRGFNYERSCITDPEKCNFVLEELLNVTKLQWNNISCLTDWQKTHMSSRQSKVKDKASILRYKEELKKTQKKRIEITSIGGKSFFMTLKTPTISEYVEAGQRWISDIVDAVEKTVGSDITSKEKEALITKYAQASSMRQYRHWIDTIEIETNIIDDKETIEQTLNVLSSDEDMLNNFIKNVVEFINHSTISVIGIPTFDCPSCNKEQKGNQELPQHRNIIPLDVIEVFFALHTQRLARLTDR